MDVVTGVKHEGEDYNVRGAQVANSTARRVLGVEVVVVVESAGVELR